MVRHVCCYRLCTDGLEWIELDRIALKNQRAYFDRICRPLAIHEWVVVALVSADVQLRQVSETNTEIWS
jgi:hypothetical protein